MRISILLLAALLGSTRIPAEVPDAPKRSCCALFSWGSSCDWYRTNGVGPGTRVILSDRSGGHAQSKTYLYNALTRLSQQYGFTLTRIKDVNDITDAYLQNAKVIIFSNGDGDEGGSIPSDTVRARVESFVKKSGWGMIQIHAACSMVKSWPFQRQACVQQRFAHQNSGTSAKVIAENRVVDGVGHGRANPYTSFLLAGLPDTLPMSDEWLTWEQAPIATADVDGAPLTEVNMLLRLDENNMAWSGQAVPAVNPKYGADHHLIWTHTQGNGIVIYNSMGHDDTYQQDGTRRAFGDTLLWREIRYAAKDWGSYGPCPPIVSLLRSHSHPSGNEGSLSLAFGTGSKVSVDIVDIAGRRVYSRIFAGDQPAKIEGLHRGVYFVHLASGGNRETRRVSQL